MLNYLKKFAVDIFPSVAATVIGAYIVNHYIVSRPATDTPAAAASTANPKGEGKAEAKSDAKPAETTASVSNIPAAGVKAKGISEKAIKEKAAAERPAAVEKAQGKTEAKTEAKAEAKTDEKAEAKADAKAYGKSADAKSADAKSADAKSADAKSVDAKLTETKSEKIRVILPSPIQAVQSSAAPVTAAAPAAPVAVAAPAAPVEAAPVAPAEERRDANELARAAIERLRANGETSPRTPEPARAHEAPKVANAPIVTNAPAATPALRPLPPPIMISGSPAAEPTGHAPSQPRPPYAEAANPNRPIPPADIPVSRPLDLRAEMAEPSVRERATAVAEDALSTAKSIFHAVLPK